MIVRTWRGFTKSEDAETYLEYLNRTGVQGFRATPGNRGAAIYRRIGEGRAEFVVVSFWDSQDVIHGFAGDDIARAVFYPEDERFLVERDMHVDHYEVVLEERAARA